MGQRLVVTVKSTGEDLCKMYFHWSAYTISALMEVRDMVAEFDYWQWFDSTEDFYDPHGHCCDICGKEFEDGETVILVDE